MNWRFNLPIITKNSNETLVAVPERTSNVNTLFLRGEKSNYINEAVDIPEIKERFPNYKLQTIANAGHWLHAEQPEAFYQAVIDFIK
jgi:pimeloyl-ACP methyl ester carboxylesterase